MPVSYMSMFEFRDYSRALNSSYMPYDGQSLITFIARNCYVPSVHWLRSEFSTHLSVLTKSLVLNISPVTSLSNKTCLCCHLTLIDSKWERKTYYAGMISWKEENDARMDLVGEIEELLLDIYELPKTSLLAVVGE